MIPWAYLSPHPKGHIKWFSHFCTIDRRVSLFFTMGATFPEKLCLRNGGGINTTHDSLCKPKPTIQKQHHDWLSRFCTDDHRVFQCSYTLQWAAPSPSKLPLLWGCGTLGLPKSSNQNDISIGFCRAHYCDRLTDRPCYSVGNNRLHLQCGLITSGQSNLLTGPSPPHDSSMVFVRLC